MNKLLLSMLTALFGPVLAGAAAADTVLLKPPAPAYPTLLDHYCGGVRTATYALGFDADGNVVGAVHAWTRCDNGRGRARQTKTYSSWHTLVWDLSGSLLTTREVAPVTPDPNLTATDGLGNKIFTRHLTDSGYVGVLETR